MYFLCSRTARTNDTTVKEIIPQGDQYTLSSMVCNTPSIASASLFNRYKNSIIPSMPIPTITSSISMFNKVSLNNFMV